MSDSVIDYLEEYGGRTFVERPFGNPDVVALSQLCYLKFDGLIGEGKTATLRGLHNHKSMAVMLEDPKYARENGKLFDRLSSSIRFRDLKISHYRNIIDKELETQFCAMTFHLPGSINFVAFRGTDETMVGWKEDFNLTYMDQVPAQRLAVEYLTEAADRLVGRFFVGGHSKGGHLSIYSAMHVPEAIQKRLINIYCLDGPGFMKSMLANDGYERIRERIVKLIPQSSVVGMMSEVDDKYTVIKSSGIGLLQHNLYKWEIERGELVVEENINNRARVFDKTVKEWIEGLDPERRQKFVDSLYDIITSCDADNRVDFVANFVKNVAQIRKTLQELDEETAQMLKEVVRMLLSSATINFTEEYIRNVLYK